MMHLVLVGERPCFILVQDQIPSVRDAMNFHGSRFYVTKLVISAFLGREGVQFFFHSGLLALLLVS